MRKISVAERRRRLVRRHHLDGSADGPETVTQALIALHATDPASVYLSVLARSAGSTLDDIAAAMYTRRSLVRWMAMRRTLFVFARADIPTIQAAVSTPLAAMLRRRLISRIERTGTEPPIEGDPGAWLAGVEDRVDRALRERGSATGAQLSADVPALRTATRPASPSDPGQNITSPLLTIMSAEGRMVRATPTGSWTARGHRWEPVGLWWPDGLPGIGLDEAQRDLAKRWLARFGPATIADVQWWTGWNKGTVRNALAGLPIEEVDLHGEPGIMLAGRENNDDPPGPGPVATLLPALDPTPMGWQQRDWFLGIDRAQIFDRSGNIGATVWWDGEIVGAWAVGATGEIRVKVLADRGRAADQAIEDAAGHLHRRLNGTIVTPVFRVPIERTLVD